MVALGAESLSSSWEPNVANWLCVISDKDLMRISMTDGGHVGGPNHGLQ